MAKEELYTPLTQIDPESSQVRNEDENSEDGLPHSLQGKRLTIPFYIVTTFLILSNIIWGGIFLFEDRDSLACTPYEENHHLRDEEAPLNHAIAPIIPIQYKPFLWNTAYSSEDQTIQDEMWDSIIWTHGMIAVDQGWAKSQNWPETMIRPNNGSQAIYLLEAYHELHCLRVIRKMFKKSLKSSVLLSEHQAGHLDHCFDSLLQVVTCNADSTPLYTWGTTKVGDGQIRKCKSWHSLRDFASQNSACFLENMGGPLNDSFSHCGLGDGLETFTDK